MIDFKWFLVDCTRKSREKNEGEFTGDRGI